MARIKGTAVSASVAYLRNRLGEEGFDRLLQTLPEDPRASFSRTVLESTWYEFGHLLILMRAAESQVALPPGRSLAWDMGRFSAEHGLNTVYRMFFKMADPSYIVKRASHLFPAYYDSGEMRLVTQDSSGAVIRIAGFREPCTEFCDRMQGWMERTIELTGSKHVQLEHPRCAARGDAYCEYRGLWD
jgi:hypothetical protein